MPHPFALFAEGWEPPLQHKVVVFVILSTAKDLLLLLICNIERYPAVQFSILSGIDVLLASRREEIMIHLTDKTLTDSIAVIGIQVRTNNARELSGQGPGQGQIGALWGRWFAENLAARIPNRDSESIFAVYSNYASDQNGDYDYLLGCPVSTIHNVPAGMTYAAISTGDYAVFTTETGPVVEVIQAAWKHIWSLVTSDELGRERAFLTDYEVYDHRAADPANSQVEIHVGLKPAD